MVGQRKKKELGTEKFYTQERVRQAPTGNLGIGYHPRLCILSQVFFVYRVNSNPQTCFMNTYHVKGICNSDLIKTELLPY